MNKKTITILIIGLVIILAFTACNRSKGNTADISQTATPDTTFTFEDGSITAYNGTDTEVIIPSKIDGQEVTCIGYGAFSGSQLTSVSIPNSVTRIVGDAFAGKPLVSITIGEGVDLGTDEGEYGMHYAVSEDFDTYYSRGGGQAGTYTKNNDVWLVTH